MDNRPIGVFDSGFGGLTAVRALRRLLPDERIVFFADNGRAPYGGRPVGQLRRMAEQDLSLLRERGVKAIVAACGTLSSNASDIIRAFSVPSIGVLDASVAAIAGEDSDAPIGVIATQATVASGAFERALRLACPGRELVSVACPDFVPLIESGRVEPSDPGVQAAVARYLYDLKRRGVGTLLLGCTHYGLIAPAIGAYLGEGIRLVDAACCAAEQMAGLLREHDLSGGAGGLYCLTSGDRALFTRLAPIFLGEDEAPATEALIPFEV